MEFSKLLTKGIKNLVSRQEENSNPFDEIVSMQKKPDQNNQIPANNQEQNGWDIQEEEDSQINDSSPGQIMKKKDDESLSQDLGAEKNQDDQILNYQQPQQESKVSQTKTQEQKQPISNIFNSFGMFSKQDKQPKKQESQDSKFLALMNQIFDLEEICKNERADEQAKFQAQRDQFEQEMEEERQKIEEARAELLREKQNVSRMIEEQRVLMRINHLITDESEVNEQLENLVAENLRQQDQIKSLDQANLQQMQEYEDKLQSVRLNLCLFCQQQDQIENERVQFQVVTEEKQVMVEQLQQEVARKKERMEFVMEKLGQFKGMIQLLSSEQVYSKQESLQVMSNFSQFQEEMVEQFRAFFEEQLISKEALISNQESTLKDLSNQNQLKMEEISDLHQVLSDTQDDLVNEQKKIEELTSQHLKDEQQLEKLTSELKQTKFEHNNQITAMKENISETKKVVSQLTVQVKQLEQDKKDLVLVVAEKQKQIDEFEMSKLPEIEDDPWGLSEPAKDNEKINELEQIISEQKGKIDSLNKIISKQSAQLIEMEEKMRKLEEDKQKAEQLPDSLDPWGLEEQQQDFVQKEEQVQLEEQNLELVRELENQKQLNHGLDQQNQQLGKEISDLRSQVGSLTQKHESELKKLIDRNSQMDSLIKQQQEEIVNLREVSESYKFQADTQAKDIKSLESENSKMNSRIQSFTKQLEDHQSKEQDQSKQMKELQIELVNQEYNSNFQQNQLQYKIEKLESQLKISGHHVPEEEEKIICNEDDEFQDGFGQDVLNDQEVGQDVLNDQEENEQLLQSDICPSEGVETDQQVAKWPEETNFNREGSEDKSKISSKLNLDKHDSNEFGFYMNQSLQDNHDEILLKEESNERQAKAKHPNNKHKKEESLQHQFISDQIQSQLEANILLNQQSGSIQDQEKNEFQNEEQKLESVNSNQDNLEYNQLVDEEEQNSSEKRSVKDEPQFHEGQNNDLELKHMESHAMNNNNFQGEQNQVEETHLNQQHEQLPQYAEVSNQDEKKNLSNDQLVSSGLNDQFGEDLKNDPHVVTEEENNKQIFSEFDQEEIQRIENPIWSIKVNFNPSPLDHNMQGEEYFQQDEDRIETKKVESFFQEDEAANEAELNEQNIQINIIQEDLSKRDDQVENETREQNSIKESRLIPFEIQKEELMVSDIIDRNPFEEEEEIQNDFVGTNPLEDLLENPLENPVETSDHKEEKCLEQFDLDQLGNQNQEDIFNQNPFEDDISQPNKKDNTENDPECLQISHQEEKDQKQIGMDQEEDQDLLEILEDNPFADKSGQEQNPNEESLQQKPSQENDIKEKEMDNLRVEATNCLSKVVESFEEKKEHDDLFKEEQLFQSQSKQLNECEKSQEKIEKDQLIDVIDDSPFGDGGEDEHNDPETYEKRKVSDLLDNQILDLDDDPWGQSKEDGSIPLMEQKYFEQKLVESDKTVQVSDEDFRKLIVESLKEIDEELLIEFDGDLMYDLIYKSKSRKPSSNEVDAWGNIDSAAGWDLDDDEVFVKVRKVTVNTKNKEYREMHEMLLEGGGEDKVKVRIQKALDRFMNSFN